MKGRFGDPIKRFFGDTETQLFTVQTEDSYEDHKNAINNLQYI